ncbi:hypothetical protein Gasu2_33680 [Galdieria sulphuraria]|uniref:Uncharacterized protein n=1 Tax=Galdieria sulphuraria TaxID=130081 RepID=M2WQE3_GALSU|nr:uncharacterized protein Gasu_63410 [Galdieria sulphuraria]EME26005.1 hypothetical protein Gasu_63410 [Galdieria sulphuraria]GJD09097.1 hypothetical protein Gasu2_33680 [Galdieria sulphuraria]|eukprot:XP_005702525.1 hypothetical protein Gasu_63410 [Galdieria sulphuraria]
MNEKVELWIYFAIIVVLLGVDAYAFYYFFYIVSISASVTTFSVEYSAELQAGLASSDITERQLVRAVLLAACYKFASNYNLPLEYVMNTSPNTAFWMNTFSYDSSYFAMIENVPQTHSSVKDALIIYQAASQKSLSKTDAENYLTSLINLLQNADSSSAASTMSLKYASSIPF